ncbi:MAG: molybdopterin cofactor-binding domain-containing protein, partial [Planctomycetota bacterium]
MKIILNREEVFYCHRGRHPTLMWMKTGITRDGAITACHLKTLLDGGAYGSYGVASTYYTGALHTVTYGMAHYKFEGARTFTNKAPCGPKRGHGTPQPRFGLECQLDKLAHEVGIDPADLRLQHLQPAHDLTTNYLKIGTMGLKQCIEKVVEGSGWRERYGKLPEGHGLGLACSSYITGAGLPIYWNNMPHSGVQLLLDRSGSATVSCGSTEIGQGSDSVLAFCVAEVLGLNPRDVRVVAGDTGVTPVDLGSYSSRVTLMSGNAAIQAAERARELMTPHVAKKLEIPASRLVWADSRVFDSEDPERGMPFAKAVVAAETELGTIGTVGSYAPPPTPGRYKGAGVGPSAAYSYSACVVEAFVDPDTGIITIPKIYMAHDIGKALNPQLTMGQVEGGVYMGLGEALMEEQVYRG